MLWIFTCSQTGSALWGSMWKYDVTVRSFEQGRSKTLCQTTPYFGSQLPDHSTAKCWKGPKDMRSTLATRGTRHRSPAARCQSRIATKTLTACRLRLRPSTFSHARPVITLSGEGLSGSPWDYGCHRGKPAGAATGDTRPSHDHLTFLSSVGVGRETPSKNCCQPQQRN